LNASLDSNWIIEHPPVDPSTLVDEIALQENTNKVETGITSASLRAMKNNRDNTRTLTEFHDEDDSTSVLADLKSMAYTSNDSWFIGKSSDVMLVWTAIESKKEYTRNNGDPRDPEKPALELRRPEFWDIKEVH
jgi:hypothetical protein